MASIYKLIFKLGVLALLLITSVDSTWNDAEGGTIPVPQDTLSWPQVSLSNYRVLSVYNQVEIIILHV